MRPMTLFGQLLSQVPSGTAENSPRLQSWVWGKRGQSPVGAKENVREDWCILSSLTGLVPYSCLTPAMNRWAIIGRPCGTTVHRSLAGSGIQSPRIVELRFSRTNFSKLIDAKIKKG